MGELSDEEARLIAQYIAAGKVNRVPSGASSHWDDKPFKDKKHTLFKMAVRQGRVKDLPK